MNEAGKDTETVEEGFRTLPFACWFRLLFILLVTAFPIQVSMASDLYVFHPEDDATSEGYLLAMDMEGSGPEVTLEFQNLTGARLGVQRKLLSPHGSLRVRIADYLNSESGLVHLESTSSQVLGVYWRVFANGVSLPVPTTTGFSDETRYLLHEVSPDSEAFVALSGYTSDVECEFVFYSPQGEAQVSRRHVLAGTTATVPVAELLPESSGLISVKPLGSKLLCYYYTRHPKHGIQTIALPLRATDTTSVRIPRVPVPVSDSLLIADISGIGTQIEVSQSPNNGEPVTVKRLLPPYGTISMNLGDFFRNERRGLIQVAGQSRFLVEYVLKVQEHRNRITVQEAPVRMMGLSWPVWQPTQITLRLWNAGRDVETSSILLNRNRASSPLQRQEVLLAPGQLIDWSPDIRADWDSVILKTDDSQTHAICLGISGTRLLFVSPLCGIPN